MDQIAANELSFKDYVAVIKRRAHLFLLVAAPAITIGIAIAFGLPAVYESTGTILVEQPDVPTSFVPTTISNNASERIRMITERVMSADNLTKVIRKYHLYPELAGEPIAEIVREMRRDLTVEQVPSGLMQAAGNTVPAQSIAFSLTFAYRTPELAKGVAKDLVGLYIDQNKKVRQELAAQTTQFLAQQANRLEKDIAAKEKEIAAFKSQNVGQLTDSAALNFQILDRTERDLDAEEQEIRELRERQDLLESELAQMSPYSVVRDAEGNIILSPQDRLKMLQRKYAQMSAVYSKDYPDMIKTKREIDVLSKQLGVSGNDTEALQVELKSREDDLAALRNKYSDDYPDVVRAKHIVDNLKAAIADAARAPARAAPLPAPPDNPQYIQDTVQLKGTQADLQAALKRREDLRKKIASYEASMANAPELQRKYDSLNRGYQQLVAQYDDVLNKKQTAEIAGHLESENKSERFTVLSSPDLPSSPSSPNRIAILLLTLVLALAAGTGAIALAEISDTTVRGARDISTVLQIPPLVVIPNIANDSDVRSGRWRAVITAASVCLWMGINVFLIVRPI